VTGSSAAGVPESGWRAYSEQLVRLEGQAIWYDPIMMPGGISREQARQKLGIPADALVLACPQSVYKLNPWLDDVMAAILRTVPEAVLLLLRGRRREWTRTTMARISALVPGNMDGAMSRILWIPRQPNSDRFMELLHATDLLLHPFPFGGSKTAGDAIAAGIPLVTMPTRHLRGRMAKCLMETIGARDLLATSPAHMVRQAVRLLQDTALRARIGRRLKAA